MFMSILELVISFKKYYNAKEKLFIYFNNQTNIEEKVENKRHKLWQVSSRLLQLVSVLPHELLLASFEEIRKWSVIYLVGIDLNTK